MRTVYFRSRGGLALIALVGLIAAFPSRAPAQTNTPAPDPEKEELKHRVEKLEQKLDRLNKDESQLQATVDTQAAQKPTTGWVDGFTIGSPDGKYKLKLGGYLQVDGRFFIDDKDSLNLNSRFLIRRARPTVEGTVFKYVDFKIMPDFANSQAILYDAYIDFNYFPEARLRIGKTKPPLGLERLQGATALTFVERGQSNNLVPNRDIGVMAFSDLLGGALTYQIGVFNGQPDLGRDDTPVTDDFDLDARIFAHPFLNTSFEYFQGLGLGVAGSYGQDVGKLNSPQLPTYLTFGQNGYFSYNTGTDINTTVLAGGTQWRVTPQMYYYYGPAGLMFNYAASSQKLKLGTQRVTPTHHAWSVELSYVLTGESKTFRGVVPAEPFDPWDGKWGAFEAGLRVGELHIDDDVFDQGFANATRSARADREFVIGTNWYLNKWFKFMADYGRTTFSGGAANGARPDENAVIIRFQVVYG